MKLSRLIPLSAGAVLALTMTACETTGDPQAGGLFGWSQQKADYRLHERESHLRAIEHDTAERRMDSRYLEGRRDAREDELRRTRR